MTPPGSSSITSPTTTPTPSPLLLLPHIAARCPELGLATAVLVTPWHQPLRMAEEIAMLSLLIDAPLYIGLGRGNAPLEYEAFDIAMAEANDRFDECLAIVRLALLGEPFTYNGKYLRVPREIRLRPTPRLDKLMFLGAVGQPSSGAKLARLSLPPMLTGHSPLEILTAWDETTRAATFRADISCRSNTTHSTLSAMPMCRVTSRSMKRTSGGRCIATPAILAR